MRRFGIELRWPAIVAMWVFLMGNAIQAQTDTMEVRVWGGMQDDRGVRLIAYAAGDMISLSSTNSTDDDQPRGWLHRLDSNAHVIWGAFVEDEPWFQPADVSVDISGDISVLGMRYANASDGYDWSIQRFSAGGELLGTSSWGTPAWDVPKRALAVNDQLWTVGTSYATGSGDVVWCAHAWSDGSWILEASAVLMPTPSEEVLADAVVRTDTLILGMTQSPGINGKAVVTAVTPADGAVHWTYTSSWSEPTELVALDHRGVAGVVVLMNVQTEDGDRLAFAILDADGNLNLEELPGSGFNIRGCDVQWYSDNDFATIAVTEELGLGGEEMLYSRWSASSGAWQGGPTFGTPWDEAPAAMLRDEEGRFWILGRTDGYSNGRDDVYLLQFPNAGINGYIGNVETDISDEVLWIHPELESATNQFIQPNPIQSQWQIVNASPSQRWMILDGWGRVVDEGLGTGGDASHLASGMYWLVPFDGEKPTPAAAPLRMIVQH